MHTYRKSTTHTMLLFILFLNTVHLVLAHNVRWCANALLALGSEGKVVVYVSKWVTEEWYNQTGGCIRQVGKAHLGTARAPHQQPTDCRFVAFPLLTAENSGGRTSAKNCILGRLFGF
jgi:hypothetical protein